MAPNSEVGFPLPTLNANAGELYKTRIWAEVDGRKTYEYQTIENGTKLIRSRPVVARLTNKWEKVFIPDSPAKIAPPADGWMKADVKLDASNVSSHYLWARQSFTVPADFPAGQRVQLVLPAGINYHARVVMDDEFLGEAAIWELPKTFTLPASATPGSTHTLYLGVTDYIVGIALGVKVPEKGAWQPGARSMAMPTGTTGPANIGVSVTPELVAVPDVHLENVFVQPQVVGGKLLSASVQVVNDGAGAIQNSVRMRVFERGQPVLTLPIQHLSVAGGAAQNLSVQAAFPAAKLWDLENPNLYELRTEILDAGGNVIDTRRDRFGFREWGTRDGYFTLNGEILKLNGGSHVYPTGLMWPTRPSPYRIMRHQGFALSGINGGGQTQGVIGANTADELGYVLKADIGNLNAHGADNYAWQEPQLWERTLEGVIAKVRVYANNPSIVMWDVANEIAFRGPGEPERMGQLFADIKRFDPTRFVTVGGSNPFPVGAEVVNFHGWGDWQSRTDYWFMRPEERPSYLKSAGYFQHKPAHESAPPWRADLRNGQSGLQLFPGYGKELRHIDGFPVMLAESFYVEDINTFPIFGDDTYLGLPIAPDKKQDENEGAWRDLTIIGARSRQIQNTRQAGFASGMIHVNGGTGRYLLPVMSYSWDRKFRFNGGGRMQTRMGVHYDLSQGGAVKASYRLFDGEKMLGEKTANLPMKAGEIGFVDLDFALPTVTTDRTFNLQIRVAPQNGGEFYDDVPITVYAPKPLSLPATQKLVVFDPKNHETGALQAAKIAFQALAKLSDWNPQNGALLIGSEGLTGVSSQELSTLAPKIEAGGRAIVLDHFALPSFLPKSLVQSRAANSYVARVGNSTVLSSVTTEDLRAWTTRERDQIVSWNPLEKPSSGEFRVHSTTGDRAPVLEVGHGQGRVLFSQLNLKDALGVEPAANRVLGDVLSWTASASPFGKAPISENESNSKAPATIMEGDGKLAAGLQNRVGVMAPVYPLVGAPLVIASGNSPVTLANLEKQRYTLKTNLQNGATLFLYGLSEDGAKWLSDFTGSEVKLESFPHKYAYLTQTNAPLTAGLGHGDFWPSGLGRGLNPNAPLRGEGPTGTYVLSGPNVKQLTRPAYVSEIPVGKGRIVVDLVRSLENPVPSQMRVLSVLLSNAGAHIDPDGSGASDSTKWAFQPLDLSKFVNWSLTDTDDPQGKRGYNGSGAGDDLREFPTGKQKLRGVDYLITPGQNNLILINGAKPKLQGGATEVKGIQVGKKAERLYFLHNAAWGVPGFTYRLYYTADRKAWIPGKPDPFVDVVVKPGENIAEWVAGRSIESQKTFLGGATVAWLGGNKRTRGNSMTGDKELGVYQMIWDNPRPNDEIESIDILSPGTTGSGHAFVFAITAANRDESGGAATAKPELANVLAGAKAADVLEQVQFPNYGFVLLKNGVIASVYDAQGQPFARGRSFKAESSGKGADGTRQTITLLDQTKVTPLVQPLGGGNRRVWEFSGEGALKWTETVIATPGRLRFELKYTPLQPLQPGFGAKLNVGADFIGGAEAKVNVNENPFTLKTASGEAIFTFDQRYRRWVFSYQLDKSGINLTSPAQDVAPWTTGEEQTLFWEITPP